MAQHRESYKAKVQLLGSTLAGAPWSSRHVSCAGTQTSRLRIPLLARGGPPVISPSRGRRFTREHSAQPVEGSVACDRVGTKRWAAELFLLVGGSRTRELERDLWPGPPTVRG